METPLPNSSELFNFYKTVAWFQRFGAQYPATAHYNGHHCMAKDHPEVLNAVTDAINIAREHCSHGALELMSKNLDNVSVATMRHRGAIREPKKRGIGTKLVKPGWGLGRHADTWAPDGEGLVLMITVADTKVHHREFQFTCPPLGLKWSVVTPDATILVFHADAYDMWEHESIRSNVQDGECISLTVRLKEIDAYYGWQMPDKIELGQKRKRSDHATSASFARLMQHKRIQEYKMNDPLATGRLPHDPRV
jgi:hypothetical protein